MRFEGLEQFAGFLEKLIVRQEVVVDTAAHLSGIILHDKALDIYGDSSKLEDLAPATQEERQRLGYTPNDPLLRTGELLKDNLEMMSEHVPGGAIAGIGSSEPIQLYHEYGYHNARTGTDVPPRPVIRTAMLESAPEIGDIAEKALGAALGFMPLQIKE